MIHYTLLPREEMKELRKEYRIRLFIVASFFFSSVFIIGIFSLLPSYTLIHNQEKESVNRREELQKNRKESGADQIEKDLVESQTIADMIVVHEDQTTHSNIVQRIISHRSRNVTLSSIEISRSSGTSTPWAVIVQGKSVTRESLLDFKKNLEGDAVFSQVELPLSDLAKSKNISFGLRIMLNKNK
jgi:hypothetical protein